MTGVAIMEMEQGLHRVNVQWDIMIGKLNGLSNILNQTLGVQMASLEQQMGKISETVKTVDLQKGFNIQQFTNSLKSGAEQIAGFGSSILALGENAKSIKEKYNVLKEMFTGVSQDTDDLSNKFGIFGTVAQGITAAVGKLGGVFLTMAGPIAIAVAAVAGIGLAIKDLWDTSETFREAAGNTFTLLKDTLTDAFERIKEAMIPLWEGIQELGAILYEFYENSGIKSIVEMFASLAVTMAGIVGAAIIEGLADAFVYLSEILGGIIEVLSGVLNIIMGIFTLDANAILEGFIQIGSGIMAVFQNLGEVLSGWIQSVWNLLPGWMTGPISSAFETIKEIISAVSENIRQIMEGLKSVFSGVINFVTGVFTGNWSRAWQGVKSIFKGIWETISGIVKVPINGVIGFVNGLLRGVANGFNKIAAIVNSFKIKIPSWLGGGSVGFNLKYWSAPSIPYLAGGGILNTGQMFIAREAGPEMVGQIGRRTAVVNNEQITTAIERAVVNGMMQVMMSAGEHNGKGDVIEIPLIVGNEEIARAAYKGQLSLDKRYRIVSQFA